MADSEIAIVGAGAAGLMAAIWAGRTFPGRRIELLEGARRPGAKILIAGGGRCNVTHYQVTAADFAGSTPAAINKVLRRFDVAQTVAFFAALGVSLKQESTGKLFPVTDKARTVLEALLGAAAAAGVNLRAGYRVTAIERLGNAFRLVGPWGSLTSGRLILATGGQSLPKTGSDGWGYELVRRLGHSLVWLRPALVPLLLADGHFLRQLPGVSAPVSLTLWSAGGQKQVAVAGSLLCTHFGLSGPAVLDISRHYLSEPGGRLTANWLPDWERARLESVLSQLGRRPVSSLIRDLLPERLAGALLAEAGLPAELRGAELSRAGRKRLLAVLLELPLPVTGSRGFNFAEATAGGVPLAELDLNTMASRICPGLYLCGEICDVDGRIGGFNFQWAWASGYLAGISAELT